MGMDTIRIRDLSRAAIFEKAKAISWSELEDGSWEAYNPDPEDEYFEGPLINYFYPLPNYNYRAHPKEDSKKLKDFSLCIVYLTETDEYGLALTGGGMDLSWEICAGYILLGYLPPLEFCNLPNISMRLNSRNRKVLAACKESAQQAIREAKYVLDHLSALRKQMENLTTCQ